MDIGSVSPQAQLLRRFPSSNCYRLFRIMFCPFLIYPSIRFAFLLTDESLTSLAKKVPDLLDYSDSNALINFENDIDEQLYNLFHINEKNQLYVRNILFQKSKL